MPGRLASPFGANPLWKYILLNVNLLLREQHRIAIGLLRQLNLDHIVLELRGSDYLWKAWSPAIPIRNGKEQVQRGKVKIPG
jgi:hypothetical protein